MATKKLGADFEAMTGRLEDLIEVESIRNL